MGKAAAEKIIKVKGRGINKLFFFLLFLYPQHIQQFLLGKSLVLATQN
jgi:hypothetical protein